MTVLTVQDTREGEMSFRDGFNNLITSDNSQMLDFKMHI